MRAKFIKISGNKEEDIKILEGLDKNSGFQRVKNEHDLKSQMGIGNKNLNIIKSDYQELGDFISKASGSIEATDFKNIYNLSMNLTNISQIIILNYLKSSHNINADFFMPNIVSRDVTFGGTNITVSGGLDTRNRVFARYKIDDNYELDFLTNRNNNMFSIRIYGKEISGINELGYDEYSRITTLKGFDNKFRNILKKYNI